MTQKLALSVDARDPRMHPRKLLRWRGCPLSIVRALQTSHWSRHFPTIRQTQQRNGLSVFCRVYRGRRLCWWGGVAAAVEHASLSEFLPQRKHAASRIHCMLTVKMYNIVIRHARAL